MIYINVFLKERWTLQGNKDAIYQFVLTLVETLTTKEIYVQAVSISCDNETFIIYVNPSEIWMHTTITDFL